MFPTVVLYLTMYLEAANMVLQHRADERQLMLYHLLNVFG